MRRFAALREALDRAATPEDARAELVTYFRLADAAEAASALRLLTGPRPPRIVAGRELAVWACERAQVPAWLFDRCREVVGDLSETIALVLEAAPRGVDVPLHEWVEERLPALRRMPSAARRERVTSWWRELDRASIDTLNRLLAGTFRPRFPGALALEAFAVATGRAVDAERGRSESDASRRGVGLDASRPGVGPIGTSNPEPPRHVVRAVLLYGHPGRGPTAGYYAEYSFALWQGDQLVPVARTSAGLEEEEIRELDRYIRRNTASRFGPVRAVEPVLVFEIGFDDAERSGRRRSGWTLLGARVVRRRSDLGAGEADRMEALEAAHPEKPKGPPPEPQGDFFR